MHRTHRGARSTVQDDTMFGHGTEGGLDCSSAPRRHYRVHTRLPNCESVDTRRVSGVQGETLADDCTCRHGCHDFCCMAVHVTFSAALHSGRQLPFCIYIISAITYSGHIARTYTARIWLLQCHHGPLWRHLTLACVFPSSP